MNSSDVLVIFLWFMIGLVSVLCAHGFKKVIINMSLLAVCVISLWGYAFFSGGGLLGNDPAIGRMFFPCCGFLLGETLTLVVILSYCLYNNISFDLGKNMINCYVMGVICSIIIGLVMQSHILVYKTPSSLYPVITSNIFVNKVHDDIFIYYPSGDADYRKEIPDSLKAQVLWNIEMMKFGGISQGFLYRFDLNGVFDMLHAKPVYVIRDNCREEVIKIARQVVDDKNIPLQEF